MKELIEEMKVIMEGMYKDLEVAETNKSAAARARKKSLEFAKVAKNFRAESVAFHKK